MTEAELGSRSDLEALQRSSRGKVVTLLVLLAIALGAAGWFFLVRAQGIGNTEDPAKVIVVGRTRGYSRVLSTLGFEAAEGTMEAWELKARDEVPDLEVEGLAAIMTLADRFGYGYVIFENPSEVDFAVLEFEEPPSLTDDTLFAVVSAGDLAFPHVMTVNPEPSAVMRGAKIDMLQALFAQEKLAETLPGADPSSMDAIALRDRLRDAIEQLEQLPVVAKKADKVVLKLSQLRDGEERAEPKPTNLGGDFEVGLAYSLANGQILTVSRDHEIFSPNGTRLDLRAGETEEWRVGEPSAEPSARTVCRSGFSVAGIDRSSRHWVGGDGASLLTETLTDGFTLWTLDPSKEDGCSFDKRGTVRRAAPGLGEPKPAAHGQVARAGVAGSQGVVSVSTAGANDEVILGMLDDVELHDVAWLSDHQLVAVGEGPLGAGLYLFDTQAPLSVLSLPSTMLENATSVHEVAVGRRGESPVLIVSAGDAPTKVFRVKLPGTLTELFASPPAIAEPSAGDVGDDGEPVADYVAVDEYGEPLPSREERGLPVVTALDPNRFTVSALSHEGDVRAVDVSMDGSWVAFQGRAEIFDAEEPGDFEIVAVPADGGAPVVVTRNRLTDTAPRLTADGSHVVFRTRVELDREGWVIKGPRVAPVAGR